MRHALRHPARLLRVAFVAALAAATSGCFDAPKLEDRWTRLDLASASVTPYQALTLGTRESLSVSFDVTYRAILTGYAVADLRWSEDYTPVTLPLTPDMSRLPMAQRIDTLLAHSVSVGRATRAVTGWDHLVQRMDLSFGADVPAVLDSTGAGGGGLFLVCYLGAGDLQRRLGMRDTLIVTPFGSEQYQVLPVGLALGSRP
ncbi:MAG: hypothetical protein U0704_12690 [Candidatus Eisenbacteria bacterium]